jgi:Methyltransferase domain
VAALVTLATMPEAMETSLCPMGCEPGDHPVCIARDLIHGIGGSFHVVRCATCGLARTDPRPSSEEIGVYYPSDYSPHVSMPSASGWKSRLRNLVDLRDHWLPPVQPGHALEVGCASGEFLEEMTRRGWTVEGIEPAAAPATAALGRGYHVQHSTMESAGPPEIAPDLVVGWMVVEHLHRPVESLRALAEWSTPNASLVISVPNMSGISFKLFRQYWYDLDVPRHLFHFTPTTVSDLLGAAGWHVERIVFQRSVRELAFSWSFWVANRFKSRRLARAAEKAAASSLANVALLPLGYVLAWRGKTRMTIWATKGR